MPAYTTPPGEEDILAMAETALAALPSRLSRHVEGLCIDRGIPMTERSVSDPVRLPRAYQYRW